MTRLFHAALMASAALPAFAVAAHAQEDEAAAPRGVDRVIVTAQRREADSQDVPIALTAISAAELDRQAVEEITDLRFTAPNVNIQKNTGVANAAQVYIRGVGQDESSLFAEVGVGIYLDGVYLGKQNGTTIDLVDLERVEVLRGPQGTYYGRNTNGGAIRFISRRPELTGTRGILDVAVGTLDRLDVRASWSAPIVEGESGFKIDIFSRNLGSDFDLLNNPGPTAGPFTYEPQSTVNNVERYGARGSFLWEPSAQDLSVYIVADWTIDNSGAFVPTPIERQADGSVTEPFVRRAGNMSIAPFHEYRGGGVSGEVKFGTELGEITSITAYRTFSQNLTADLDGPGIVDLYQELDQWQFTQEVQLVGGNEQVDYVLGAYYFRENVEQLANNRFNQIFSGIIGQPFGLNDDVQDTTSWAVFGETTFHLNDQFSFTLGGRYTSDEKTANRRLLDPNTLAPIWDVDPSFDDTNFSWRAVAQYRPNDNLMVYGSYSTGYKAGGLAGTRPITTNVAFNIYEPEELSSWEVGLRSDLFDNSLRFNATYFYSVYDALQLSVLEPATFQFGVINADAIVHGLELEGVWAPTDQFQLSGNLGTTNFRYDEGSRIDPAVGIPFDTLDGKQFPDLSARLNAVFFQPTELGEVAFGGSATHSSAFARNVGNSPAIFSDEVTTFDVFAQLTSPDGRWRLKLEGKNITDEDIFLAGNAPGAAAGSFGSRYYTYGAVWSASLRLEF
ncbi:MAG: TonB-dependent receptor [Oceanicaulis sp.]|nr:TonB-dependent receptor [Oceanicaulis sp.]